jgi:hypothetical protein
VSAAKDRVVDTITDTKDYALNLVNDTTQSVLDTFGNVGTRATDAALRGVIAVDKTLGMSSGAAAIDEKLGVSEKATAAVSSLDERFAITQKYADALSKVRSGFLFLFPLRELRVCF